MKIAGKLCVFFVSIIRLTEFSCSFFSQEDIERLRKITMWDIIVNSTSINADDIQKDVFVWRDGDPCEQPGQLNTSALESCNNLGGYNYFTGSELPFVYACVFLAFVPILCLSAGYGIVKLQNRKRRRLKVKQETLRFVAITIISAQMLSTNTLLFSPI